MGKKYLYLLVSIMIFLGITGCQCKHESIADATCSEPAVCNNCGVFFEEQLGHDYQITLKQISNCVQTGLIEYTCNRCGDTYSKIVPTIEHSGDEKIIKEPTLTDKGEKQLVCDMCGQTVSINIPMLGLSATNPYPMKATTLYKDMCKGNDAKYTYKYIQVSGRVKYISDYGLATLNCTEKIR